ncbi:MAG: DinB family protein [Chloroflexi bacterium]|nr:DinB family protein [Chloroflexota bacterium]
MDTIEFLREQLGQARGFLEGTMGEIDDKRAHAAMPGVLNPIAATYAHLATGEDGFVQGLIRGQGPLFATSWAGRTGLSERPPERQPDGGDWHDWAARVRVDLGELRSYAAAVGEATDAFVGSLTPGDLDRAVDLSPFGFGERTLGWVLGAGVLGHVLSHWGEICALNGAHGGRGFPR